MITFRVDVDYPYPSRIRSFIYTTTGIKMGRDYLKNSKIAAKMINESSKEVRTYWFFTPETIPDKEMMGLLDPAKHEVGLHIANDPLGEMRLLGEVHRKKDKVLHNSWNCSLARQSNVEAMERKSTQNS